MTETIFEYKIKHGTFDEPLKLLLSLIEEKIKKWEKFKLLKNLLKK